VGGAVRLGIEKGIEEGRQRERREILNSQLEERFGPLSGTVRERLAALSRKDLAHTLRAVVRAQSLGDLGLEG
jgi:hypothetical protein